MYGHEQIIQNRLAGHVPRVVFFHDEPMPKCFINEREVADTVCTHGDVIQLLDLRFVVGLRVSISSGSEVRAKALFERCKAAGASVVAAVHTMDPKDGNWRKSWCEIWHKPAKEAA